MWNSPSSGMSGPDAGTGRAPSFQHTAMTTPYTELHLKSFYSFGMGASHTHEMLAQAKEHGYGALALTDTNLCGALEFARLAGSLDIQAHYRWRAGTPRRDTACTLDQDPSGLRQPVPAVHPRQRRGQEGAAAGPCASGPSLRGTGVAHGRSRGACSQAPTGRSPEQKRGHC